MKNRIFIILPLLLLWGISLSQTSPSNIHELALSKLDKAEKIVYINEKLQNSSGEERHGILDIALALAKKEDLKKEAARWHKWRGIQYYYDGDYPKALDSFQESLSIAEAIKDKALIGATYNEMAIFSMKQKDFDKSESYLIQSLKACTQVKDSVCMSTSLDNRGLMHMRKGEFEKANDFFLRTLKIRELIKDSVGLGYVYNNLGSIAIEQGFHDKAFDYVKQSTKIRELLKDSLGVAINICNMGEMSATLKKYPEAIAYFEKSLLKAEEVGLVDFTQWVLNNASQCYVEVGNMDKAHAYLKRSYELKDSLLSVEKIAQITEMETKYETEKKEQQIELQQKRMQLGIVAFVGFGLLSLLGFLYYRSRQITQQVREQKQYQKKLLETSLTVQETERKRIAKDLHDGVGQQLTGLKMAMQQLSGKTERKETNEALLKLTGILDDATTEVRNISHQMMPRALQEFGLTTALEDMVEKSLGNSGLEYDFSSFRAEGRYDEKIEIGMYRVAQELINNLLKHAEAKEVSIQLLQNKTHLILTVEDDGKGFDVDHQKSMGHGLMNIQSRVQAMDGKVRYESGVGRGTLVSVRVLVVN